MPVRVLIPGRQASGKEQMMADIIHWVIEKSEEFCGMSLYELAALMVAAAMVLLMLLLSFYFWENRKDWWET